MTDDELTGSRMASPILGFTPGPWTSRGGEWIVPESHSTRRIGASVDPATQYADVIATIRRGHKADARLIAAAPDLLAALIEAEAGLVCKDGVPAVSCAVFQQIRAAIRKATGDD